MSTPSPQVAAARDERSWFARHKIATALLAFLAIGVVGSSMSDRNTSPSASVAAPLPDSTPRTPVGPSSGSSVPSQAATTASSVAPKAAPPVPAKPAAPKTPGIGTPVRDGKFEFTVTRVKKGVSQVGGRYFNEKAQGQFVLVYITVKNIGEAPQYLSDSEQRLRDSRGRAFSANSTAALYMDNNDVLFNEINPGNSVKGILVFDMPKDAAPASLEVHDSFLSDGVIVRLT